MKYPLLALAIFLLLAQLVSGGWYVKKCANKNGRCRSQCRIGEFEIKPKTGMCTKEKLCCVLNGKELNPLLCGSHSKSTTAGPITTNAPEDEDEETTMTGSMTPATAGTKTEAKSAGTKGTPPKTTPKITTPAPTTSKA